MFKKAAPLVIVPLVLLIWARLGAQPLALFSFNALVNYPSPYTDPIQPGKEADPVSKQVVLVMVDALRADTSRTMPAVNALRRQGGDCTAQVGLPSFSLPGWTVIGTGAWQEQSGVTLNFYKGAVKVDSIFDAAKRKGLTSAIVAQSESWKRLFPLNVDWNESFKAPEESHHHLPEVRRVDDQVEAAALKILKENKPNLLLYYLAEPDDAGHGKGAASPEYRDAAATTDARIARLVSTLNLNESTLIVMSDHGMLDVGGHGGNEPVVTTVPIVLAGKGIKPGSQCSNGRQADIAPTLAALLGTSIPAHNQGRPLLEMLDMPAAARAQRAVDTAQEIADRYAPVAKFLGASPFEHTKLEQAKSALASGNADTATGAALADIENTNAQFVAARDARLWQERLGRLPIALLILLPLAFYLWVMWRMKWGWRAPIAGLLTYLVVYNGLYFGRGLSWSLSVFNDDTQIEAFFQARTIDAMIALLAAFVVIGLVSRRQDAYTAALNSVNSAFLIFATLAVQIIWFYWLWNVAFAWYLPDLTLGFKYYLDVLQTSAFWPLLYVPLLVILPFITLGVRWVAARVPVGK